MRRNILREQIDVPHMHFLPKPFSVQQIAETAATILAGTPDTAAADN